MESVLLVRAHEYDNVTLTAYDASIRVAIHSDNGYLSTKLSMEQVKDLIDNLTKLLTHEQ